MSEIVVPDTIAEYVEKPIHDKGLLELREALPHILTTSSITNNMRTLSGDGGFSISDKEIRRAIYSGQLVAYVKGGKFAVLRADFINYLSKFRYSPAIKDSLTTRYEAGHAENNNMDNDDIDELFNQSIKNANKKA